MSAQSTDLASVLSAVRNLNAEITSILPGRSKSKPLKPNFDVAIITSTPDEFESISGLMSDVKAFEASDDDSCSYFSGVLSRDTKSFSVLMPYPLDMGVAATVSVTTKTISNFRPPYIFMVGVAAGNKNINKVGDILIAEKTINYDEVVAIEVTGGQSRSKSMQNPGSINKKLKNKLTQFSRSESVKAIRDQYPDKDNIKHDLACYPGLLVTGSSLVRSQSKVDEILKDYHNVVGLDMETVGFYYAAAHTLNHDPPKFVSLKAVSDFGDNKPHELPQKDRKQYALYTSSHALVEFILGYL